jgi:hypothetical protein
MHIFNICSQIWGPRLLWVEYENVLHRHRCLQLVALFWERFHFRKWVPIGGQSSLGLGPWGLCPNVAPSCLSLSTSWPLWGEQLCFTSPCCHGVLSHQKPRNNGSSDYGLKSLKQIFAPLNSFFREFVTVKVWVTYKMYRFLSVKKKRQDIVLIKWKTLLKNERIMLLSILHFDQWSISFVLFCFYDSWEKGENCVIVSENLRESSEEVSK